MYILAWILVPFYILIDEEHTPALRIIIINRVSSIGCVVCLKEKNCKKIKNILSLFINALFGKIKIQDCPEI